MTNKHRQELIHLLTRINNTKLMDDFLEDLLTPAEFLDIIVRWQIIKLLSQGLPQRKISEKLKVSIAKITRGSRELQDKKGGFWQILDKLNDKKN